VDCWEQSGEFAASWLSWNRQLQARPFSERCTQWSFLPRLPPGRDQLSKLAAHVEIASRINASIDAASLAELGKLEQDLVYGDATSKEVIAFLTAHQGIPAADKVNNYKACSEVLGFVCRPAASSFLLGGLAVIFHSI
jgi:syntaxin-binding protein 1